jgi:hypothetical protein
MRGLTLLLTLVFAVGASAPCVGNRASGVDTASQRGELHAHSENPDEPTCHAHAAPALLKAPCPCGCDERAPGATGLGSLGVALLQPAEPVPSADGAGPLAHAEGACPRAPGSAIEKVPRAA